MQQLTENAIRSTLLAHLRAMASGNSAQIIEEFGVDKGAARIDVAVVSDRLIGYEIKSDFDTFDRLSNQIHAFNRVFDEIILITGSCLQNEAARLLPSWWGITAARRDANNLLVLDTIRPSNPNPVQEPLSLAMLLWKDEALDVLHSHCTHRISARWNRLKVYEMLSILVPLDALREAVSARLGARPGWRIHEPLPQDGDL